MSGDDHEHEGHHHHHEHEGHHHHHEHGGHHHHHEHGGHHHHHERGESVPRERLSRGAGRGKILFFDAKSGVAGDMTIAALIDLGVPAEVIEAGLAELPIRGYHLHVRPVEVNAIAATHFDVHADGAHPPRNFPEIERLIEQSAIEAEARTLACAIFLKLAQAEAHAHRVPIEHVHFHEVGAVDAIVDIVGAAIGLTYLGAEVRCSPLPLGSGFVRAAHGVLFNPPPAVVHCLRGAPTYDAGIAAELVTPTGAAIVATAAVRFERWPALRPEHVGYGAGTKRFADRPNVLRLVLGDPLPAGAAPEPGAPRLTLLEANVDDMTGEFSSHALRRALEIGALDAWATPVTMKKGRPGVVLSVLCRPEQSEALTALLLSETTSLGVRSSAWSRVERPRRELRVETRFGPIRGKVATGEFGPAQVKPEFEDCRVAAVRAGVTLREVWEAADLALRRALDETRA